MKKPFLALVVLALLSAGAHQVRAGCEPQTFSAWIGPHTSKSFNLCTNRSTFIQATASGDEDIDGVLYDSRDWLIDSDADLTGTVWLQTAAGGSFTYRLTNTTDAWVLVRIDESLLD